jgi:hypothetical protein
MDDDDYGIPVLASRDEVNIIQYNHKVWACCSDCRSNGAGDYEYREVEDVTEKYIWACSNCARKIKRFAEHEDFDLSGSEAQLQIWVASWLQVSISRVAVSIDA